MGWREGEGLGRTGAGPLEPLALDIKTDKKGTVSSSWHVSKGCFLAIVLNSQYSSFLCFLGLGSEQRGRNNKKRPMCPVMPTVRPLMSAGVREHHDPVKPMDMTGKSTIQFDKNDVSFSTN
jgi:hypothetical protein